jgi:hypothetical protein
MFATGAVARRLMMEPMSYEDWKWTYPPGKLNEFLTILERDGNPPSVAAQIVTQRMRLEYSDYVRKCRG